eukprot:2002443-Amphidinium_carterae.1
MVLRMEESRYGPEHPEVARMLSNLGKAYGDLGDAFKQRDYLERALRMHESSYGPVHPEVASILNNLGKAYGDVGDAFKQRDYLERALRIQESHYGEEHPEVARTLANLGIHLNAYGFLGDAFKQRDYQERALRTQESHYGPEHPEVARMLNNLGNAYGSLGDASKQRDYQERALRIQESRYGPEHPEVATTLGVENNRKPLLSGAPRSGSATQQPGSGKCSAWRFELSARASYKRALQIFEASSLRAGHPTGIRIKNNLALIERKLPLKELQVLLTREKLKLEETLANEERSLGQRHIAVATSLTKLADLYGLGRLGEATRKRELLEQ